MHNNNVDWLASQEHAVANSEWSSMEKVVVVVLHHANQTNPDLWHFPKSFPWHTPLMPLVRQTQTHSKLTQMIKPGCCCVETATEPCLQFS